MDVEEVMNRWQAFAMQQRDDYMAVPMSAANLERLRVTLEAEKRKQSVAPPSGQRPGMKVNTTPASHQSNRGRGIATMSGSAFSFPFFFFMHASLHGL